MSTLHRVTRSAWPVALLVTVLALWLVGCEREITGNVATDSPISDQCFGCHNGQLDAAQGEWAASVHASGASIDYTNRPLPSDCVRCHNQDGYVDWVTTGAINPPYGNAKAIGCFACHNPHETGNFTLRSGSPVTLANGDVYDGGNGNQCVACHQSRGPVTDIPLSGTYNISSSRFGPHHGPQGDLTNNSLLYTFGATISNTNHRSVVTGSCVGCHMANPRQHAGYEVGGHSMNQDDGTGNNLADNCTQSGCHDAGALEFDDPPSGHPFDFVLANGAQDWDYDGVVEGYQTEMEGLLDSLRVLLEDAGIYDPSNGRNKTGTFDAGLAGAYWNYISVEEDRSLGIHNFQSMAGALRESIDYVNSLP